MVHPAIAVFRRALVVGVAAAAMLSVAASAVSASDMTTPSHAAEGPCPDTAPADVRAVEVLPLRGGFIDPPVSAQIEDILDLAAREDSELVVLQYSSRGGVSVELDDLVERIRSSPTPVAVLVGPVGTGAEAAGAAGVIWAGAHVRALAPDASVGPLRPADLAGEGGGFDEAAFAAAFADRVGADASHTQRLVDESLDAEELHDAGLATLVVAGLEPLLVDLDGTSVDTMSGERQLQLRACEVEIRFHTLGLVRRMLHAATTGPFIYLLLVAGIGALLFELFQPGFGVAGIAGIVTGAIGLFGLTVLPVTWWAVALVVLGLLLYALDTAIAGFGLLTLAATASFVVGSLQFYASDALALNVWLVAATALTAFVFFVFVMTSLLRAQAGPEGVAVSDLVGRPGIVRSVLNPEGHVYIDGALWRARWTGDARRAKVGTPVRVHAVEGAVVLVEPFDPEVDPAAVGSSPQE